MEVIDILMIVTLGVSLVDLALFGCCVWMGYQREKDRTRKGNRCASASLVLGLKEYTTTVGCTPSTS